MHFSVRSCSRLTAVILLAAGLVPSESPGATIHRQLQRHVPAIVDYLNSRDLKTVGVLKFRVRKPGQKTSDSVGPLNSLMADRLEVGLILANPFDPDHQLKIIRDASAQAARIPGANHVSSAGRATFFGPKFKLAWGDERVTADAFLTGVVQVHDDNRHVTVGILCFDKAGGTLEKACEVFEAELDAASLGEIGESFVLRGAFDGGTTIQTAAEQDRLKQQQVLKQAAEVKQQLTAFPLKDASAPVRLEIFYDGQPVTVETRDGRAFVAEPQEDQRVELALVRTDQATGRLGVVLKVNGENTLYRQTIRDIDCSKWILSEEHTRTVVKGYQMPNSNTAEEFTVLSTRESASRAVNYGRHVGQIQVTVFREEDLSSANDLPPSLLDEDEEDLAAMLRGTQPSEQPKNLGALKTQIRTADRDGTQTRGLIVQGQQQTSEVRKVIFTPDPTPVMTATVTYYSP
ncbi:MAG: hypothetical protein RIK87_10550 [Fuerstiella sp.]